MRVLLDTGIPVSIVSLEFPLDVLAQRRPQGQSPEEWLQEVDKCLEPTTVSLLQLWGWEAPRYVKAIVQVQKGAPAKLLMGTDLLGFLLVCMEVEKGCGSVGGSWAAFLYACAGEQWTFRRGPSQHDTRLLQAAEPVCQAGPSQGT